MSDTKWRLFEAAGSVSWDSGTICIWYDMIEGSSYLIDVDVVTGDADPVKLPRNWIFI